MRKYFSYMLLMLLCALATMLLSFLSCSAQNKHRSSSGDKDAGHKDAAVKDAGKDAGSQPIQDAGFDAGPRASLTGVVYAPEGTLPISGALVYLTNTMPDPIPGQAYCNKCEDMQGHSWALTNPDGSFKINKVTPGKWLLVVKKGQFRLVSDLEVTTSPTQSVPSALTTLPGESTDDGRKTIPRIAVTTDTQWDRIQDLLAKLGLGQTNANGVLIPGTEHFDIYNHDTTYAGKPAASVLFDDASLINSYHMIFVPCIGSVYQYKYLKTQKQDFAKRIQDYVAAGGKWYGSCWAYDWVEQVFPEYIEFQGNDAVIDSATLSSSYDTSGTIHGQGLMDWLQVVEPSVSLSAFPLLGFWVLTNSVASSVDNGMGPDGGPVVPMVWASDNLHANHPMTVTFPYGCGKVFFTAYHTVEESSPMIRPQEKILTYLIMEIGVCSGDYIVE